MYQAVGVVRKEGLTLMDGVKYQSTPLHTDFSKAVLWQKGLGDSRWAGQAGQGPSVSLRSGGGGRDGSPVRLGVPLKVWQQRSPRGDEFLEQGLIPLKVVLGTLPWGIRAFPDTISFLSRITTRAIAISSFTSVLIPSNILDNKLLYLLILKQEWHYSKPVLEMVKFKKGTLPFLDLIDGHKIH